jgi:hypothetical protein
MIDDLWVTRQTGAQPIDVSNGTGRRSVSLVVSIARKAGPNIAVATVVPWALFLVGHHLWGLAGGILLALAWSSAAQMVRVIRRRPWSALLVISSVELLLRSSLAVAFNSASTYFLAPAAATAVTGLICIGCALRSSPFLSRIISELIPTSVLESSPRAGQFIRTIALAYGLEQVVVAGLSVAMFLNVSVTTYAAFHPLLSWLVLATVLVLSAPVLRRHLALDPAVPSDGSLVSD